MARSARSEPPTMVELEIHRQRIIERQECENLPGFDDYLAHDTDAAGKIDDQQRRMSTAIRDADESNLEKNLGIWISLCRQVNEAIAEEYRQSHLDPETWELRYLKWMVRVTFIRFDSPLGEFYLVPQKPKRRPKATHWYTADEMIDMLNPTVAATIIAFATLPVRPDNLEHPGPGEQHVHIDLTGPEPVVTCEIAGGLRREGTGIR